MASKYWLLALIGTDEDGNAYIHWDSMDKWFDLKFWHLGDDERNKRRECLTWDGRDGYVFVELEMEE